MKRPHGLKEKEDGAGHESMSSLVSRVLGKGCPTITEPSGADGRYTWHVVY